MKAPVPASKAAFTLLEVMMSLMVMAIGMFAVFSSIGMTVNSAKVVSDQELVSQAMENRMEQMQASIWERLPETFMGTMPVSGVQTLPGREDIITTSIACWDNETNRYVQLQDPRKDTDWYLLSEAEKQERWAAIAPDSFDILLITLRADWRSAVGPITSSMEFILIDRDGVE